MMRKNSSAVRCEPVGKADDGKFVGLVPDAVTMVAIPLSWTLAYLTHPERAGTKRRVEIIPRWDRSGKPFEAHRLLNNRAIARLLRIIFSVDTHSRYAIIVI